MPLNRSTLLRLTTIDRCLQNKYRRWTLDDLIEACSDALYEMEGRNEGVSRRTIQADIQLMRSEKLGYNAPIVVKDRKYYTYDDPDYSITNIPLTGEDIETLNSAVDILRHFQIFPQFSQAGDVINKLEEHISVSVKNRTPAIDLERNDHLKGLHFVSELYHCIQNREAIYVDYRSFRALQEQRMIVSPYLLKEYRNRWFLLCKWDKRPNDVLILAIDRLVAIEHDRNLIFSENELFDPEHFFDDVVGVTKSISQHAESVSLWVDADQAPYVLTKPIHKSQRLIKQNLDGSIVITICVVLNYELEREIFGYAEHIKVKTPYILKNRIKKKLQMAALMYASE